MDKNDTEQLKSLDKSELINLLVQRDAHIRQLQNILKKGNSSSGEENRSKPGRPFDFQRFKKRHIALKLFYLGWDYHGFVTQEGDLDTIEDHLFQALLKTKLIESRETSNYHRCGRTDRGVSAFSQVISLDVRTRLSEGLGVFEPSGYNGSTNSTLGTTEIEYVSLLNRVLPNNIQVLSWSPVDRDFSARFSCTKRVYKYYFPAGDLNLQKMEEAAKMLEGEHDFRNLCKMDIGGGVTAFIRNIFKVTVTSLSDGPHSGYTLCEMTVEGNAFLWHQIRCIMGVLYLVGKQDEEPEIIKHLLNVEDNPCKPQYSMATDFPLVLYDCDFGELNWQYDHEALKTVLEKLQKQWTQTSIRTTIIHQLIDSIERFPVEPPVHVTCQDREMVMGIKSRVYKPLLERPKCDSLEEKIKRVKRKKLDVGKSDIEATDQ